MDKNALSINSANDNLTLRPTQKSDVEIVFSWFRNEKAFETWAGPRIRYPQQADELYELLQQHGYYLYSLISEKGTLLAFGQIQLLPNCLHLGRLAVNPDFRGKGISYKLIDKLASQGKKLGNFTHLSLFVYTSNNRAIHTYKRFGFVQHAWPKGLNSIDNCLYMKRVV
jgi:ribosomal protein S18 acetylase RimI-like enzyme